MAFPETIKLSVKKKAHFKCCLCHSHLGVEIHHILPQKDEGEDSEQNAAPLCPSCHDTLGDNPSKRKWIQEARDHWFEVCAKRFAGDAEKMDVILSTLEKIQSQIALSSEQSYSTIGASASGVETSKALTGNNAVLLLIPLVRSLLTVVRTMKDGLRKLEAGFETEFFEVLSYIINSQDFDEFSAALDKVLVQKGVEFEAANDAEELAQRIYNLRSYMVALRSAPLKMLAMPPIMLQVRRDNQGMDVKSGVDLAMGKLEQAEGDPERAWSDLLEYVSALVNSQRSI